MKKTENDAISKNRSKFIKAALEVDKKIKNKAVERHNSPEHKEIKNAALKLSKQDLALKVKQASLFLSILGLGVFGGYKLTRHVEPHYPAPWEGVSVGDMYIFPEGRDADSVFKKFVVLPALLILFGVLGGTVMSNMGTMADPNPNMRKFKKAARKILGIKNLKEDGDWEKFMQYIEEDKKMQKKLYKILQKFSKQDRAYFDNLLKGGLNDANFAAAIAIIAGHLESHPEEYNRLVEIINESDLPDEIKAAYGNTIAYVPAKKTHNIISKGISKVQQHMM